MASWQHSFGGFPYFPGHISWEDKPIQHRIKNSTAVSYMKQSAELGQLLHWNKSVEDFEKGESARQQPWQRPWQTGCHLVLSCSLPPSRHYNCGSQVSLHFQLNRFNLPLSGGYLHNSNHSLSPVKLDQDTIIWQLSLGILSDMMSVCVT